MLVMPVTLILHVLGWSAGPALRYGFLTGNRLVLESDSSPSLYLALARAKAHWVLRVCS